MSVELESDVLEEIQTENVKYYNLVFHNDETTHFDFVMFLLVNVIEMNEEKAYATTLKIHNSDSAPVFQSIKIDVLAKQKEIMNLVLEEGFNFKTSIEED